MKNEKLWKILDIAGFVVALVNAIFFLSMRCIYPGIASFLGYTKSFNGFIYALPAILCAIYFLHALCAGLNLWFSTKKKLWKTITIGSVDLAFVLLTTVIVIMGAIDYLRFVFQDFLIFSLIALAVALFFFFLCIYPKTKASKNTKFQAIALIAVILVTSLGAFNLNLNAFDVEPVVYAVEDEYQIVFSSTQNSIAYVDVGEKRYTDQTSGGLENSRIHKVSVPMEALDEAKSYTIGCQKLIYKGPFGGFKGRELTKTYSFKPVDTTDGIQYYSLSDIHMNKKGSLSSYQNAGDIDFLVLGGDIISMVDTFNDANYVNLLAHKMTKGEIPVLYARGNHEVKGNYADKLYRFVGSKNQKFYYSVHLANTYFMVLDIGEDHDDDWWEFYGIADYETYRNEQIEFIKEEKEKGDYLAYDYRAILVHIPLPFVNNRLNHVESKTSMVSLLNEMDFDIELSGHQHQLFIFEPGLVEPNTTLKYNTNFRSSGATYKGYLLDFKFPTFLVSRKADTQTGKETSSHIGLKVEANLVENVQTISYQNSKGNKVNVVNPFYDKDYGDTIKTDLTTNQFLV